MLFTLRGMFIFEIYSIPSSVLLLWLLRTYEIFERLFEVQCTGESRVVRVGERAASRTVVETAWIRSPVEIYIVRG